MPNPYFQFKEFTIWHDRCAMKVGTDGVLLGTWVHQATYRNALDVGAGSGLISLILAQRMPALHITALEIDPHAASQAQENVGRSPWKERIHVICQDFTLYETDEKFDLIVSNPPFFADALECPDGQRNLARHTIGGLHYESLLSQSAHLLHPQGRLCLIIPANQEQPVTEAAWRNHLYPCRLTRVFTKAGKPCRRVLMAFSFQVQVCPAETLLLMQADGTYSPDYVQMVRDFYLKM